MSNLKVVGSKTSRCTWPEFQVQSRLIHVGGDGYTLHRYMDKVPFGEFLRSVNMGMEGGCFLVNNGAEDGEQKYCNDSDDKLRVFVNGKEFENPQPIADYIFEDNDRILVINGNETSSEIKNELDTLNQNSHPENPKLRRISRLQIANTQYPRDHTDLIQTIQILSYHW